MKQRLKITGNKAIFKGFSNRMKQLVEDEITATSMDVADLARRNAPSDQGFLKNSITSETSGLNSQVEVRAEYAAYMEFGTGTLFNAPSQLESYAAEFKGNTDGSFEEFKQSLKKWMKRKGIEEEAFYPILMKILKVGIAPKPFLFPAFQIETAKMMVRLTKIIRNGTK